MLTCTRSISVPKGTLSNGLAEGVATLAGRSRLAFMTRYLYRHRSGSTVCGGMINIGYIFTNVN